MGDQEWQLSGRTGQQSPDPRNNKSQGTTGMHMDWLSIF